MPIGIQNTGMEMADEYEDLYRQKMRIRHRIDTAFLAEDASEQNVLSHQFDPAGGLDRGEVAILKGYRYNVDGGMHQFPGSAPIGPINWRLAALCTEEGNYDETFIEGQNVNESDPRGGGSDLNTSMLGYIDQDANDVLYYYQAECVNGPYNGTNIANDALQNAGSYNDGFDFQEEVWFEQDMGLQGPKFDRHDSFYNHAKHIAQNPLVDDDSITQNGPLFSAYEDVDLYWDIVGEEDLG